MSSPQPPSLAHQSNGQLYHQSQASAAQWNGATGAVQVPDSYGAGATGQQAGTNTSGKDAIREGKQRAREVMAAAGVTSDASSASDGIVNGSAQTNGRLQLSRKRSRDGTQLPVSPTTSTSNPSTEQYPPHDQVILHRTIQRDLLFESVICDASERSTEIIERKRQERDYYLNDVRRQRHIDPGSVFGRGFMGYGNRTTDDTSQVVVYNNGPPILYSSKRRPPKGRRARELYMSRKDNSQQSEQHEELVPVRLDIELDKLRLRDTFTWNLHEKLISHDHFIEYLLEDLKVPPEATHEIGRQVKQEMLEQIHNYYPHLIVEDGPLEPRRPYVDHKDDEMRILIKLNITIGRITLIDQFEWDINNPLNSPEEFARSMAFDNALSGEFTTAIAHSIREQSQLYTKSLYLTNHCFDGRPVEDPDLRDALLPNPIYSSFRPHQAQKDWAPFLYEMTEAELERTETSMMREHRAQKRQLNRRGGPALPDLKERQRTVRSLIVHSVIPGAVDTFETTGIPKMRRSGRGGRRGAARMDGDVDSEDLESEESGAESPAPSVVNTGTTARTRGMRGAASAAQAAMRAGYGRSMTPELQMTPHETRTSNRRSNLREEDAVEDDTLVVKLKIGKAKLRAFWNDIDAKKRASQYPLSGYATQPAITNATPGRPPVGTPARSLSQAQNTPQPNGHSRTLSSATQPKTQTKYDQLGRADFDHWPNPDDNPPPPPPWLNEAITSLRELYPDSDFEPVMRPYGVDASTGEMVKRTWEPGTTPPANVKFQWLPRIRCHDCPTKLYTALPGKVMDDFQVHLRNRIHREHVEARQEGKAGR